MFSEDQVFGSAPIRLPAACKAMLDEYKRRKKDPNSTRVDWSAIHNLTGKWTEGTATLRGSLDERKKQFNAFRRAIKRAFPDPVYFTTVTTR